MSKVMEHHADDIIKIRKLEGSILGEFEDYGFTLKETDDHILSLYLKDKKIADYYQSKVTTGVLLQGCRNFLQNTVREVNV